MYGRGSERKCTSMIQLNFVPETIGTTIKRFLGLIHTDMEGKLVTEEMLHRSQR